MNDEQRRDLAALWALDALDPEQRRAFETTVAGEDAASEETLAEAVQLRDTAALLGGALPQQTPPERLRASVLDAIAVTPQLGAGADAGSGASAEVTPGAAAPRRRRMSARFALAASVVVALTLGGAGTAALLRPAAHSSATVSALAALSSASDRRVTVTPVAGGGTVTVLASAMLGRAAVSFDGVAKAPSDRVYEVWFMRSGGVAAPAGTLAEPRDGSRMLMAGRYAAGDAIGVTVEPVGGSPKPTTTPIAVAVFS